MGIKETNVLQNLLSCSLSQNATQKYEEKFRDGRIAYNPQSSPNNMFTYALA